MIGVLLVRQSLVAVCACMRPTDTHTHAHVQVKSTRQQLLPPSTVLSGWTEAAVEWSANSLNFFVNDTLVR
jgi:hypothetical protein